MKLLIRLIVAHTLIFTMAIQAMAQPQIVSSACPTLLEALGTATAKVVVTEEISHDDDTKKAAQEQDAQTDLIFALAHFQEREIAQKYFNEMQGLEQDIADVEKCGGGQTCLVKKLKLIGLKLKRAEETIYASWRAEPRAKKLLRQQIESVVGTMADETMAQALGKSPAEQDLKTQLLNRVGASLVRSTSDTKENLLRQIGDLYIHTVKTAIERKNIRTRPEVRRNLYRGLAITLSNQAIAQALTSFDGTASILHHLGLAASAAGAPATDDLWIYGNTFTMMNIQAEIGGEKTPFVDKPYSDYEGLMESIPDFVNGTHGFVSDFKDRFKSFFFISTLEFPIVMFFRVASTIIIHHGLTFPSLTGLLISTLISLPAMYAYMSAKGAAFDQPLLLNGFPNYFNGTRNVFEKKLYDVLSAQQKLPARPTSDGATTNAPLSFEEFQKILNHNYVPYESYFEDQRSPDYDEGLASAYKGIKSATHKELIVREVNALWDSIVLFMIVHGANAAYQGSLTILQEIGRNL